MNYIGSTYEGGTFFIPGVFLDSNSDAMTPNSCFYTITNDKGSIINSLDAIGFTPNSSFNIKLSGADLDLTSGFIGTKETRFISITGEYDNSSYTNLPLRGGGYFDIINLKI